jgi:hypothetical protein
MFPELLGGSYSHFVLWMDAVTDMMMQGARSITIFRVSFHSILCASAGLASYICMYVCMYVCMYPASRDTWHRSNCEIAKDS